MAANRSIPEKRRATQEADRQTGSAGIRMRLENGPLLLPPTNASRDPRG